MKTQTPLNNIVGLLRSLDAAGLSDGQLLKQFSDHGDERAFESLVRRHLRMVFGVCQRTLRHLQDAEDATQATFLVLARKAGIVSWHESIAGWLHEVAVRVAREARGAQARRRLREQLGSTMPEKASGESPLNDDLAEILDHELSALPDQLRAPLVLCYLQGKTRDEAAAHLGWTLATLKRRLERAREILRTRLGRHGLTAGAVLAAASVSSTAQASVSAVFLKNTVATAVGHQLPGAAVLDLAARTIHAMFLAKVKTWSLVGALLGAVSLGLGFLASQGAADNAPRLDAVVQVNAAPKVDQPKKPVLPKLAAVLEHRGMVRAMDFSADGKLLATCSLDGTFRIWDRETAKVKHQWNVPKLNSAVAFAPDGKRVAGGNADGELYLWDATTGKEIADRRTRQGNIFSLAFNPDGSTLVSANKLGTISFFDGQTGAHRKTIQAHDRRVWFVTFSPDGSLLASGGEDSFVRIWNGKTGDEIRTLEGHAGHVATGVFSRDGKKLYTADMEDTLRNVPNPEGLNDSIRSWDVATGKQLARIDTPLTHWLGLSPDGKLLASADRFGSLHLWDAASGARQAQWKGHDSAAMCVIFDNTGRRLASSDQDGNVRLWNFTDLKEPALRQP